MIDKYLKKYLDTFHEGFPMIPLAWGRTDNEIVDIIKKCLDEGKNVYGLGFVDDDDDILY